MLSPSEVLDVSHEVLIEQIAAKGVLGRLVSRWLSGRLINVAWLFTPLLLAGSRTDVAILMHGNANFTVPVLRILGIGTILVCDAPDRRQPGIAGWVETLRWHFVRQASRVVQTFPFNTNFPVSTVHLPLATSRVQPGKFDPAPIAHLVYVGRLAPEKGIRQFLALAADMPDYRFTIFGAGALEPEVRQAQGKLANLQYHGFDPSWVSRLPPGACIVGCSRLEACWTAGAEALLGGVPVLAVESVTGGPEAYRAMTDKAIVVARMDRHFVLEAIGKLNQALSKDTSPVEALSARLDADSIRASYVGLITEILRR